MLSEQEPEERLERPPEIDDGALLRIQQVRPVEKTASPIIDHNQRLDALVQKVIAYLAQSGVTFSIHNACKKVCTKSHKADFNWLYDWCHDHERKIRDAVDALRAGK